MASGDVPGQPAVDHNLIDFDTEYVSYSYTRRNTRIPSLGFAFFSSYSERLFSESSGFSLFSNQQFDLKQPYTFKRVLDTAFLFHG